MQEDDTRTRVQVQDDDGRKLRGRDIVVGMHDSAYNPKAFKVVATYAAQIKGMQMDGKHKTRDLQRWKKVEVQEKRSYAEVVRRSRYQDELDIGAGTREKKGAGRQVQDDARNQVQVQDEGGVPDADAAAAAEGGQVQGGAREDIQVRLRRAPDVIMSDTWANRAQRTRQPRDFFKAGTRERGKRPGRGRRDR